MKLRSSYQVHSAVVEETDKKGSFETDENKYQLSSKDRKGFQTERHHDSPRNYRDEILFEAPCAIEGESHSNPRNLVEGSLSNRYYGPKMANEAS